MAVEEDRGLTMEINKKSLYDHYRVTVNVTINVQARNGHDAKLAAIIEVQDLIGNTDTKPQSIYQAVVSGIARQNGLVGGPYEGQTFPMIYGPYAATDHSGLGIAT